MSTAVRALLLVLLLPAGARAAEHDWPAPPNPEGDHERVSVSLDARAGLVEAPFFTAAFPEVSGFATRLTPAVAVHFPSLGWLGAKLPVSIVRLDFPAGAQVAEAALGNLELAFERPYAVGASTRAGFSAAFVAPTAGHGPERALLDNRTLALGSALDGGREAALLTPGVTGLRLGVSAEQRMEPFQLRLSLDVPVLVRLGAASLPEETTTHSLGVLPSLALEAFTWIVPWFGASLGVDLVTEAWRVQEPARARDRNRWLQPIVEPGLRFRAGRHVELGLRGSIPVFGSLGGRAFSAGIEARVGF